MRGVMFVIVSFFWIFCLITIFAMADIGLRIGGGKEVQVPISIDVYSMQNALDASKTFVDTGLIYSLHQACYGNLNLGGWNNIPESAKLQLGDKVYVELAPETDFKEQLTAAVIQNMKKYTTDAYLFMSSYEVMLPEYSSVELPEIKPDSISVSAESDKSLSIEKSFPEEDDVNALNSDSASGNMKERISIKKPSSAEVNVKTICYGVYSDAFQRSESMKERMRTELKKEVDNLLNINIVQKKQNWEDCNGIVVDAEKRISEAIKSSKSAVKSVWVDIEIALDAQGGIERGSDGMYECKFKENAESAASAEVVLNSGTDKTYPVWNGKDLSFESITVNFAVQVRYKTS